MSFSLIVNFTLLWKCLDVAQNVDKNPLWSVFTKANGNWVSEINTILEIAFFIEGQHESCNENFYWTNADNGLLQIKQKHDKIIRQGRKLRYGKHLVK